MTHVLGYPGEEDVEANAIALKHRVRIDFPDDTLAEAEKFPRAVRPADRKGREDLRQVPLRHHRRRAGQGLRRRGPRGGCGDDSTFILRVAIADVSHYVRPGSAVDDEAAERGTSTYFPDRVFPMLPEALSNHLCSLVPREDRLVDGGRDDLQPGRAAQGRAVLPRRHPQRPPAHLYRGRPGARRSRTARRR